MAGTNGQSRSNERSDGGAKRNLTVKNVKGCLGLVDTAAADSGEDVKNQNRNDQSDQRGRNYDMLAGRCEARPQHL